MILGGGIELSLLINIIILLRMVGRKLMGDVMLLMSIGRCIVIVLHQTGIELTTMESG